MDPSDRAGSADPVLSPTAHTKRGQRNPFCTPHAHTLLALLEEYLTLSHQWEAHLDATAQGTYKTPVDMLAAHRHIQSQGRFLIEACRREGFPYATLRQIVPAAYSTTRAQREAILSALRAAVNAPAH